VAQVLPVAAAVAQHVPPSSNGTRATISIDFNQASASS